MNHYVTTAVAVLLIITGWFVRGWYEDSRDLAAQQAVDKAVAEFRESERRIAATLEVKLNEVQTNERIIERWRTEVVDRPVYHIRCIDDDGLRIINGELPSGTAEPTGEMP